MLLEDEAYVELSQNLLPLADVITPNFYETQKLTGFELRNENEIKKAATTLQELGAKNVLLKGKHEKISKK